MRVLSSLTNRIFLASAALVIGSIGLAIFRVNVSVSSQAEQDLQAGLTEAVSLVDEFNRRQFADFVVKGQLIADLPVLKGAAATRDAPTVEPIADEYARTIGADLFVVLDRSGTVLASAGRVRLDPAAIGRVVAACRGDRSGTCFWPAGDGLLHVTTIAFDGGLGTLVVGVSLDRAVALRIKAATSSEIAVVSEGHVVASSFDAADLPALGPLAAQPEVFTVRIGAETYIGRARRLTSDAAPDPAVLVLRSRSAHMTFLSSLRLHLALTGLAAVLGSTLIGYFVARSVTRPLRALTHTMREMASSGDLSRPLPAMGRWDDEDVRLVETTFRQLTGAIDRFQRQAAVKDRLASLGRMSTVVAHEIRNPLMIIKAVARGLRRHTASDVAAAAASIDEEVVRLDGVVSGVLDFARPMQFSLEPGDLSELCRAAIRAVGASRDDAPQVPVAIEAPMTAPIITDVERLRAVLVNVLENAQQATLARTASGAPLPVVVRVVRPAADSWRVEVADSGTGIGPDDLPHVFDPYFTTRRTGTGLGLAIARNIIEGLGGRITVESRLDEGTTVRIDLPVREDQTA